MTIMKKNTSNILTCCFLKKIEIKLIERIENQAYFSILKCLLVLLKFLFAKTWVHNNGNKTIYKKCLWFLLKVAILPLIFIID